MTWAVDGLARGAKGQTCEVTWGGIEDLGDPEQIKIQMTNALYEAFPDFFGADPVHTEVHVREEDNADPGETPTAV